MKIRSKKIVSQIAIASLLISSVFANGFPSEPMVIYGNIIWADSGTLSVIDENNVTLKTVNISSENYGTNQAFDFANKVSLSEYSGVLSFRVGNIAVSPADTSSCNMSSTFQSGALCSYDFIMPWFEAIDTSWEYLNNLDEWNITTNISNIGSGTIVRDTKQNLVGDLWNNLLWSVPNEKQLLVFSDEVQITRKVVRDIVIVSDTRQESILIWSGTVITQSGAQIGSPVEIFTSKKVNINLGSTSLTVHGGLKIPTNKALDFNQPVRVCMATALTSLWNLWVYYSQDDITWIPDIAASSLSIADGQVCFDTDHFTSFAVATSSSTGGATGGWGGGSSSSNSSWWDGSSGTSSTSSSGTTDQENIAQTISQALWTSSGAVLVDEKGNIQINSKDYITSLRMFNANSKKSIKIFGHDMINLKDNDAFNKGINKLAMKSISVVELKPIQASILSYFDDMTITYGIYTNPELDDSLKSTYKAKLINDLWDLQKAIKSLQIKDRILSRYYKEQK